MSCSFSVLVGPSDLPFAQFTLPHQARFANSFSNELFLVIDDLRRSQETESLINYAEDTVVSQQFTRVIRLSSFTKTKGSDLQNHFGKVPRFMRDFRGVPLLGWYAGLVASDAKYHFHADSDILFSVESPSDWYEHAVKILTKHQDVLSVAPLPGPPLEDCSLLQADYQDRGEDGLWFKHFSSRRFLIQRETFSHIFPLHLRIASRKIWLRSLLARTSPYLNWELLVNERMIETGKLRVNTRTPDAWSLHCDIRGQQFEQKLPTIIERMEQGGFPESQSGKYDLELSCW